MHIVAIRFKITKAVIVDYSGHEWMTYLHIVYAIHICECQ